MAEIIAHGHLDQWDEEGGMVEHGHAGGDKPHRHPYTHVGGITPHYRYVPPSLRKKPYLVADWSDTRDL